jgi:hypothetical protein
MSKSRFPYVVLAAMLIAEFAVQGAETTRGAKHQMIGAPRSGPPANQVSSTQVCPNASETGQTVGSARASRGDGFASGIGVSEQRSCNVDIAMTYELVSEVSYSGPPGGRQ